MSLLDEALAKVSELQPSAQWAATQWINDCFARGFTFRILEVLRTESRQNQLYAQGRTKPGPIVTYLDGTKHKSNHQLGLACDIQPINCYYSDIAMVGERYGIIHPFDSGKFIDLPHFEFVNAKPQPPTLSQMLNMALKALPRFIGTTRGNMLTRQIDRLRKLIGPGPGSK